MSACPASRFFQVSRSAPKKMPSACPGQRHTGMKRIERLYKMMGDMENLVHRHIHCDFYQPKLISNLPQ
uniref:Uncharacterized protein n=1 Tax=mine drainage metagenome TaxID=410659 RepID=E6QWB1_9ZZZZ